MPVQQREKTEGRAEEVELRAERTGLTPILIYQLLKPLALICQGLFAFWEL
jgi:hypothetical protein